VVVDQLPRAAFTQIDVRDPMLDRDRVSAEPEPPALDPNLVEQRIQVIGDAAYDDLDPVRPPAAPIFSRITSVVAARAG
jgi:hypothetical protein